MSFPQTYIRQCEAPQDSAQFPDAGPRLRLPLVGVRGTISLKDRQRTRIYMNITQGKQRTDMIDLE